MKTFRRFGLLVICAAVGVGWAIIVGTCSTPANDPEKSSEIKSLSQKIEIQLQQETAATNSLRFSPHPDPLPKGEVTYPSLLPTVGAAPGGETFGVGSKSSAAEKTAVAIQESVEKPKEAISRQAELPRDCVVTLPPPSEPSGPVLAQPYPRTAQEYMPPPPPEPGDTSPGKSGLPGVMKFLQERLATPGQATDKTASSPAPSQANRSPVKSTIKGEGDGKLRIHIYDEDIHKVLDLLSEQGNLNILASKNVEGKVSATLNGVDLDSALDAILKSTGYVAKRDGNYIFVGTPEDFNNLEQSLDKIGTRVYQPNYITAAELKTLITPLMSEKVGAISVSTPSEVGIAANDSNAGGNKFAGNDVVVVRDYEAVLAQIDQMVEEVERASTPGFHRGDDNERAFKGRR